MTDLDLDRLEKVEQNATPGPWTRDKPSKNGEWVISWRANRIKADATLDELEILARALRARAGRLLDGREHNDLPWNIRDARP